MEKLKSYVVVVVVVVVLVLIIIIIIYLRVLLPTTLNPRHRQFTENR